MLQQQGDGEFYGHMNKKQKLMNMDRISDIPDPIIHHIMCFLTNLDVTKLSILSKRFSFLCRSFPVIEFDEKNFAGPFQGRSSTAMHNRFLDHILNSVNSRRLIDPVLSEFRVNANLIGITTDDRFDSSISIVLEKGVKTMDLNLGLAKYKLPDEFASKWINVLRLKGFQLDLCKLIQTCPLLGTISLTYCIILEDIEFSSQTLNEIEISNCNVNRIKIYAPNLHSFTFKSRSRNPKPCLIDVSKCLDITYLSLNNVVNGETWIEQLVYNLGKLKTFILNGCQDIEQISVWNEKLERLEIRDCPILGSTKIIARSLEYFVYKGTTSDTNCVIEFVATKFIKDMSIEGAFVTDQWLETQIAILGCLESLRLRECSHLSKIRVYHEKLKILGLKNCMGLKEAEIDTPELESFVYHGNVIEFERMVTRNNCTATLFLKPWITHINEKSFYGWRQFLSFFGHCKALILICTSQKEVMIPEWLREKFISPLYDLEHLEIQISLSDNIDPDLVDSLLWLSPLPNTLSISYGNPKQKMVIKFAYTDMVNEEDKDPFCCILKPIKCWKHYLSRVEIHSSNVSHVSPNNGSTELKKYFLKNVALLDDHSVST